MIGFGQNVIITDANFKAYLVGEPIINTNGDTEIQVSEAADMLGQETPYIRNTPLFYIYDDGTLEKRIVIE